MATIRRTHQGRKLSLIIVTDTGSTNIEQMIYDAFEKTVTTSFNHGGIYQYQDVSLKEFKEIYEADSIGKAHKALLIDSKKVSTKIQ